MKTVGLFEAKARLSELCDRVAESGESIVISRRGQPLVRIDPLPRRASSIWEDRERYLAETGRMVEEFEILARSRELPGVTLEE